jgi:hypothetical protein
MHETSMERMKEFVEKYLDVNKKLRILDVGSYDVNGTYKDLFDNPNWKYTGLDIEKGPNVDVVTKGVYDWDLNEKFNVVISGQCIEHVEDLKEWSKEFNKILKENGLVCVIGPNNYFGEHRYPVDCWRIFPDGMKFLLEKVCDFKVIECFIKGPDCVGIAKKIKK